MTYEQWEAKLKELLTGASEEEIKEAIGYYKEIYSDKKEAGLSDEEIVREFGAPEECAGRISYEADSEAGEACAAEKDGFVSKGDLKFKFPFTTSVFGAVLFSIFVTIPLFSVLIGGISAFVAASIGGAAAALGGVGMIVLSFVQLFIGGGASPFFAMIGMGIASVGAGVLCAISFFFITKHTVLFSYKLFKSMYIKEVNENEGN